MSEQIPVDKIKPSPYQPRLTFDLEDIRGSIEKDGILVALTVREKDGYYELVDGERRWRLAKQLGYKTVKCDVVDVDDETARRMVWKVNTLRKDYTPKEKAYHFKKLQKMGLSLRGIARECDYDRSSIIAHLNVFKLPNKYQSLIWAGKISITAHIQPLNPMFNGGVITPQITKWLDEVLERKLTHEELRKAIKPDLEDLERKRVESAKKAVGKITTEVKEPETPEELEKAAEALKKEAKKRKSEEQILEEKRRKAEKALLKGRGNALSKVESLKKLGVDTVEFDKKIKEIKAKIFDHPDLAYEEIQKLKKDVKKAKKVEEKRREEEKRKKREEQIRKEAEEQERQRLLHDKDFFVDVLSRAPKVISAIAQNIPVLTREQTEQAIRAFEESEKELAKRRSSPKLVERSILVKNWMAHTQVVALSKSIMCPVCKANFEKLVWKCHNIPIEKAQKMLKRKLEES